MASLILAIFFASTILGYYFWKRDRDKDYLWLTGCGIIALLADGLGYAAKNLFQIPTVITLAIDIILIAFWPAFIFIVARIALKRKHG